MSEVPSLRPMQTEDLGSIVLIEAAAQPSPWGRLSFEEAIDRDQWCKVLCDSQQILGYSVCAPIVDELHILNIVIARHKQGVGLAHYLMQELFDAAQAAHLQKIFLEVRASNVPALALYSRWGFEQIGIRKQYYRVGARDPNQSSREDAIVMMRAL